MILFREEIEKTKNQIVQLYNPYEIILVCFYLQQAV